METVPGLFVDPQTASIRLRLTFLRLFAFLLRLPISSPGPLFDAVLHYYNTVSRLPNNESLFVGISRLLSSSPYLSDISAVFVAYLLTGCNVLLSRGFRLQRHLLEHASTIDEVLRIVMSPVEFILKPPELKALMVLALFSFSPDLLYQLGSRIGQADLVTGALVQLGPIFLILPDVFRAFNSEAKSDYNTSTNWNISINFKNLQLLSKHVYRALQNAHIDLPPLVDVYMAGAAGGGWFVWFDPVHDHVDMAILLIFSLSFCLVLLSIYYMKTY